MVRRIFAIVLIVLGLGTIGAAIASGTVWRPDDRVTLTLPATPDVPVVITAPGVLNAVDNVVDVRLVGASSETPIVLAMAREADVRAWVGEAAHWEITGLTDWETLTYVDSRGETTDPDPTPTDGTATEATASEDPSATESAEATDEPTPSESAEPTDEPDPNATVPNPAGSDLWVEELTGAGELEYSWTAVPGRWVMLVASDGATPAPQVELTWDREVETPFVRPGIILGSVVLLLGLGLLILQILADLEKRRSRRAAVATAESGEIAAVVTAEGDQPLTRREIRRAEEARRRGGAVDDDVTHEPDATEAIPAVAASGETATSAATPEEGRDAGELDAWVRSGTASPLLHEGERSTPVDLEVPEEQPSTDEVEGTAAEPTSEERSARGPWWRRRAAREESEADAAEATDEPEGQGELPAEPAPPASAQTDEIPAVETEQPDAQEWGASWRETWGLGSGGADDADETKEGDR